MATALNADELQSQLTTRWLARECLLVDETDSTNTLAAQRAEEGVRQGFLVAAEAQTKGRGRLQRAWHSPHGVNLYFSIVLRPQWDLQTAPPLSLAAGVAIAEAISETCRCSPELKWPNDVLVEGRKVAGVLVEAAAQRGQLKHVILGIGVNVNQTDFPAELAARATSLRSVTGHDVDRTAVLAALMNRLEFWIDALGEGHGEVVIERWRHFAPWLGQRVRVAQGESVIVGEAIDIEPDGGLRLLLDDGQIQIARCGDASGVMGWTY